MSFCSFFAFLALFAPLIIGLIKYYILLLLIYNIVKPNITSIVEFHNRYNNIIIPLIEQDQTIIITDIIKKKLSKHKKNFSNRFR